MNTDRSLCSKTRHSYRVDQLLVDHVLHRGGDRLGLDGVDLGPREAQQTVVSAVLEEARAELLGELDGLALDDHIRNGDGIRVDVARGRGTVAIADVPGAGRLLRGGRLGGIVDGVALGLPRGARELGAVERCQVFP